MTIPLRQRQPGTRPRDGGEEKQRGTEPIDAQKNVAVLPSSYPGILEVFVATRLANPLNRREFWAVRAKRAKLQRGACHMALWAEKVSRHVRWRASSPKRVEFLAHVARKMDSDGLSASLKAVRDGLIDAGLIHDDGPDSGHEFVYSQVVATPRGVRIRVARRAATP